MSTSSTERLAYLEGIALWTPTLPHWDTARAVFREEQPPAAPEKTLPAPAVLTAAERRRAPESVVVSLHVAEQAVSMSGLRMDALKSVFVSANGDLAVTDAMCETLARAPHQTSPTRFHHSVHNAGSGYWAIAARCQLASTAITAKNFSFAVGLLEALCQCAADSTPVLLVGYDIEAVGSLRSVNGSRGTLAVAFVISPIRTARSCFSIDWSTTSARTFPATSSPVTVQAGLAENGLADALPFVEALAQARSAPLTMPLSAGSSLRVSLEPLGVVPPRSERRTVAESSPSMHSATSREAGRTSRR